MNTRSAYPFYKSLRFRFGILFGILFLLFLSGIVVVLYYSVTHSLQRSFQSRLQTEAYIVLQKTEISPLTVPLPQKEQFYRLTYTSNQRVDTLFNNVPESFSTTNNTWQFMLSSRTFETGGKVTILYVLSASELTDSIQRIQQLLFICIPLVFLFSLFIGYLLSGFLLKPVTTIIAKANDIDLLRNIHLLPIPATEDEFYSLTTALNRMLQRISKQSQEQNAFFASASHELRTPLSNMLTQLQVSKKLHSFESVQSVLSSQIEEVQRLTKTVNDFLLMSQLKANTILLNKTKIDVADLCLQAIEKEKAPSSQIKIVLEPEDEMFEILGDKGQVKTIMRNLINNAVTYNKDSCTIIINLIKKERQICLQITNQTNEKIENPSQLKKEFARNNSLKEGFGLGLWLTDQLANLNNATLNLDFENSVFKAELIFSVYYENE